MRIQRKCLFYPSCSAFGDKKTADRASRRKGTNPFRHSFFRGVKGTTYPEYLADGNNKKGTN
jgi:hypothetical protein